MVEQSDQEQETHFDRVVIIEHTIPVKEHKALVSLLGGGFVGDWDFGHVGVDVLVQSVSGDFYDEVMRIAHHPSIVGAPLGFDKATMMAVLHAADTVPFQGLLETMLSSLLLGHTKHHLPIQECRRLVRNSTG